MKRMASLFLCLILLMVPLISTASATYDNELKFEAEVAVLMSVNNESGKRIFNKNADKEMAPASLTKIATAAVVLKEMKDQNKDLITTKISVTENAMKVLEGTDSSTAGLVIGEELTVLDLLYSLMVSSGNDAANVFADYFGGGNMAVFVEKMNALAKEVGCTKTQFKNAHGLDEDGHYTTANDLIKLTQYALTFEIFEKVCSTAEYTLKPTNKVKEERKLETTNLLMNAQTGYYLEGVYGIKTGHTDNAGRCVVTIAKQNGYQYIAVIMNAPFKDYTGDSLKDNGALLECKKMLEWAFENIRLKEISSPTHVVMSVPLKNAWGTDKVQLVPKEGQKMLALSSLDASKVVIIPITEEIPKSIDAPVNKGDLLGKANVFYMDTQIGTIDLVASESIKGSIILRIYNGFVTFTKTIWFKLIIIFIVLLVAAFIIINILYNRKKQKRRMPKITNYGKLGTVSSSAKKRRKR